jgi:hypothetical protein
MNIDLKEIKVRDLTNGYQDNAENGVVGFSGKLDIRPPYQREFIYKDKQRDAVINTVTKIFPLNVMYWAVREDGNFEIIDGQQRTISICQYVNNDFSINGLAFHNLPKDKQEQILDYKLMVYFCSGTDSEKLDWFETINIAGEELTPQELKNAVYSGSWVSDAKRYFSKNSRQVRKYLPDVIRSTQKGKRKAMEKPVDILQMLIEASTDKGMVILDPFMGTGSTIEACIRTERNYIGIEINKEFYQHTENRISSLCGGLFFNSFSTESSIETK